MINFNNIPPMTKNLLIANVVVFLGVNYLAPGLNDILAAYFPMSENFMFFQVLTHMFMHGSFSHLFFNMFAVWMFGASLENYFGPKKYLILYFAAGLGAYVLHEAVNYWQFYDTIQQGIFNNIPPVVGASGCLFGILVGFAVIYPNTELMLMFIPVPIKAKYFVGIYMLIELFSGVSEAGGYSSGNVAHFAHIGGGIVGFFLVKYWMNNRFRIN